MHSEGVNLNEITESRRKAIAASLQPVSAGELQKLVDGFFPYPDHPWKDALTEFAHTNSLATYYHATTDEGIHVIYCSSRDKGMWFLPGAGVGLLQTKGLALFKELTGGL